MITPSPTQSGAIFLSYASQDVEAARRISDSLRAAGLEVWFDRNELTGGDEWDAKIKRQIRECALFVPIISSNTQARSEGYFRREWNLAAQRLLDMAPGRPFLLPVAIDDTLECDAIVAEEFLRVQWMRLPGGNVPAAGVERVRRLLEARTHVSRESASLHPLPPREQPIAAAVASRRPRWWIGVAVVVVGIAALSAYWGKPAAPRTKQLAILPFNSIGDAPGNQVFCDGLTETITAQLTQLEQFQRTLLVVPTSELRKEGIASPRRAGAAFGATVALTGSVQRVDTMVRVTVNLVDVSSLRIIRGGAFDHPTTELYRLQDRVATQVAEWLGLDLSDQMKKALGEGQTSVASAYDLYVEGRGELTRRDGPDAIDGAIVRLQQALIADPRYALAHAALGEAFWLKYTVTKNRQWLEQAQRSCRAALQYGARLATPHVTLATLLNGTGEYEQAAAEAETALQLDPASVEAIRALARAFDRLNRSAEAEAAFKRALLRSPENPQLLTELAVFYWRLGRMADAEKQFLLVARLTPENSQVYRNLGGLYVMMGRPEEAATVLEKSIALRPTASAYSNLGTLRFQQGRYADAAGLFERAGGLSPRDYLLVGNLGDALRYVPNRAAEARETYARAIRLAEEALRVNPKDPATHASLARYHVFSGDGRRALEAIEQARALGPANVPVTFSAGIVYECAGDRERALDAIARAIKGGYSRTDILQDPDLKNLRADARFTSLLSASTPVTSK
ncbi:tetratricopeptide repeat protein [Horticoccus sp. 23ND18S-11]|uniref:tetratricopeptide repeat protein n=1 Tax=Horticoccus sp. 23ND18S-11 TaxID=3391832 RepID=UPI0039C9EC0B